MGLTCRVAASFNKGNGGLDLGGMKLVTDNNVPDYFVPVNIWLDSMNGVEYFGLAYSEDTDPFNDGRLAGNTCVRTYTSDAQVKRLTEGSWSIESNPENNTACLWDLNADLVNQPGTPIHMPFYIEITIK